MYDVLHDDLFQLKDSAKLKKNSGLNVVKEKELLITVYYGTQTGNSKVCYLQNYCFQNNGDHLYYV